MTEKIRIVVIFGLLLFFGSISTPISAKSIGGQMASPTNLGPFNTVILSNKFDARFSRDFSILLKHRVWDAGVGGSNPLAPTKNTTLLGV